MQHEKMYLYVYEDDTQLPAPPDAREVVDRIWPTLAPFGHRLDVERFPGARLPARGRSWDVIEFIPLLPDNAAEAIPEYGLYIGYFRTTKQFRGGFSLRANLHYDESLRTDQYVDDRAALLVATAEDWLEMRPGLLAHLIAGPVSTFSEKANLEPFPDTVAWWTWINEEMADAIGREKLLRAPVFRAYELAGGVAWQLTERFTQKPHPSLLSELKKLFPDRKILIQTGA